jgi:hypothetical protein
VPQYNEGTTVLKAEVMTPTLDRARPAAIAVAGSADRREKIAASKRGKPRPPHVIEAMRRGRTGEPQSEETQEDQRDDPQASRRRLSLSRTGRRWVAARASALAP